MWYATCHSRSGAWVPSAGRCGLRPGHGGPDWQPRAVERGLGGARVAGWVPGVCGGLVCGVCGACQASAREAA